MISLLGILDFRHRESMTVLGSISCKCVLMEGWSGDEDRVEVRTIHVSLVAPEFVATRVC